MVVLKGWRYGAFIAVILGGITITLYPIVIEPIMHIDRYKQVQKRNRAGVKQEEIQPGNMRVWSDPFKKREDN